MGKINLDDNVQDVIKKLADGNPGALTFLFDLVRVCDTNVISLVESFILFDEIGLYGSELYMLWNDSCDRDTKKVLDIVENVKIGKISQKDIIERVRNVGRGKSFDDLLGGKNE